MPQRHTYFKTEYSGGALGALDALAHHVAMSKRKHFIRQWRQHRGLNQVQLAERVGITQGHLSKVENFKKPYDEDLLLLIAEALRCDKVDLLIRDPTQPEGIWSIWDNASPGERQKIVDLAKVIRGTGTDG